MRPGPQATRLAVGVLLVVLLGAGSAPVLPRAAPGDGSAGGDNDAVRPPVAATDADPSRSQSAPSPFDPEPENPASSPGSAPDGGTPGAAPTPPSAAGQETPEDPATPGPTPVPPTPPPPAATPPPPPPPTPPPPPPPPPTSACPLFPASNVWNRRVDGLPVAANSSTMVNTIGASTRGHPDFGSYLGYGIPFNVVGAGTPRSSVSFQYASESDPGPYPIPANPQIEGGSDRHLLMWDTAGCMLYELFAASHGPSGWTAGSGAIWNLRSNALRPDGWTSADAAGLPILPGLIRYDEVAAGAINHAIRFTAPQTRSAHIYPARHHAGAGSSASLPPMGLRLRLKATFDMSAYSQRMRVILVAMQRYGIILADNGSPWFFSGVSDTRWNDSELNQLKQLRGSDFEVVDTTGFVNG